MLVFSIPLSPWRWICLLTKSLACSLSVNFSRSSRTCSSRKVGLFKALANCLPGVPGTLMALLSGDLGVMGMATDSRLPAM